MHPGVLSFVDTQGGAAALPVAWLLSQALATKEVTPVCMLEPNNRKAPPEREGGPGRPAKPPELRGSHGGVTGEGRQALATSWLWPEAAVPGAAVVLLPTWPVTELRDGAGSGRSSGSRADRVCPVCPHLHREAHSPRPRSSCSAGPVSRPRPACALALRRGWGVASLLHSSGRLWEWPPTTQEEESSGGCAPWPLLPSPRLRPLCWAWLPDLRPANPCRGAWPCPGAAGVCL